MPTGDITDPALISELQKIAGRRMSKDEIHRQRVSFIYGNLPNDSDITRAQVEAAIANLEGAAA